MLSSVLSKENCANCRFCCSFRRQSLWETPLFDAETVEKLSELYPEAHFKPRGDVYTIDIDGDYKTDDSEEEALCPFNKDGCILGVELKPFDCSIWPLRVMRYNGGLAICLTPTCPVISQKPLSVMRELADGAVGDRIADYARSHPFIVKDYKEGFPVLRIIS
ncbi:MAG: hypothetical protein II820_05055 [Ruminiclostridium sp.]|nr:hypothetical protein [Ruminiclostridium sp.]